MFQPGDGLHIIMAASEATPYAKVGGLADVAGSLPAAIQALGHKVTLFLPLYRSIDRLQFGLKPLLPNLGVPMGTGTVWCSVLGATAPAGFDVCFIEHNLFFGRPGIYDFEGQGYSDNGDRYTFFSRAVLQACLDLDLAPEVFHCHDWMTAAIPGYLKYQLNKEPRLADCGSVLTIHNVGDGYQGKYPVWTFLYSGLPSAAFRGDQFEDFGGVNLLKGGIALADILNAVSPTFAREITEPIGGCGLDGHILRRRQDLHGILNGVDYADWSPETDPYLEARYSADDLSRKALCKAALQKELGLEVAPGSPLLGVVSRLNYQKGLDLVAAIAPELMARGAQIALLGMGDPGLESVFRDLSLLFPGRFAATIGFDNRLAHIIEAGADLFLMPSRWEPCGLNQLYSLRYGTPPIVRATGGLADTVVEFDPIQSAGTGFLFGPLDPLALRDKAIWAMEVYRHMPEAFRAMQIRAMKARFTWEDAARKYAELYRSSLEKRKSWPKAI